MTNDFKPAKAGGNQPRLSKEEYAEKKRAEKEKIYVMRLRSMKNGSVVIVSCK